ncbi:P43 5S RNA-binding protein-like [Scleropages formosus]|uniref:P43 5S RNA-binding protein-like n=1 Tax=Scleropages formosus TaxID=113540 RepID=UPI0010FAAC22|nr:P43 5S RNA-binding protein-like [Scleropages formosus]
MLMNSVVHSGEDAVPPVQIFRCPHEGCGATFSRERRLREHQNTHTGERPLQCPEPGCHRKYFRKSHLSRHQVRHTGQKSFRCTVASCGGSFYAPDKLKRHVRYAHGDKDASFQCHFPDCTMMFRKRKAYKSHLIAHGIAPVFKCKADGCAATFETSSACRAHGKTHTGYSCPQPDCQIVTDTWGKMCKHLQEHTVTYTCKECQKSFGKRGALRRHKRSHGLQKPVLRCTSPDCKAYFTTTFNLQHHIRKVHLQLLKYPCNYPECSRAFAMRESLNRHLLHHDPSSYKLKRQRRVNKSWRKRLERHKQWPLVEDDLSNLFALRMRLPRCLMLEANLTRLFNERLIPHPVEPEVNLRDLFNLKPDHALDATQPSF